MYGKNSLNIKSYITYHDKYNVDVVCVVRGNYDCKIIKPLRDKLNFKIRKSLFGRTIVKFSFNNEVSFQEFLNDIAYYMKFDNTISHSSKLMV